MKNISELDIHDHRKTKEWAIRLASEAAITILRVDQIIIAKPAGGPKMQKNTNWDEDWWVIGYVLMYNRDISMYKCRYIAIGYNYEWHKIKLRSYE